MDFTCQTVTVHGDYMNTRKGTYMPHTLVGLLSYMLVIKSLSESLSQHDIVRFIPRNLYSSRRARSSKTYQWPRQPLPSR
jgi:hypothetical protein